MSLFIDSGVGLVVSMVPFSSSIQQQKQVHNCKANDVGVVYNEKTNRLHVTGACKQITNMVKQLFG